MTPISEWKLNRMTTKSCHLIIGKYVVPQPLDYLNADTTRNSTIS